MTWFDAGLLVASVAVSAPMTIWSIECLAALLPRRKYEMEGLRRPNVVVLVPAHNEAQGIQQTLRSLLPQMREKDRIVVIADNCTDDTAQIARTAGCIVFERSDAERRGKSYALDYGLRSINSELFDVVIVIDADCALYPEAIDYLSRLALKFRTPVQGSYTLEALAWDDKRDYLAAAAFEIRNFVRPLGLQRLGFGCLLNGTGMAFPVSVIKDVALASGRIAEDRWLTVDLALAGHATRFCPEARVTGALPHARHSRTQITRWLHGHLECMLLGAPRLLMGAIREHRFRLLGLFAEFMVPPISLLLIWWMATLLITGAAGLRAAAWTPFALTSGAGVLMGVSFYSALAKFAPRGLTALLVGGPSYMLSRLPILVNFLFRREKRWVRTERDPR